MPLAVLPLAVVDVAVGVRVLPAAVLEVILILALVFGARRLKSTLFVGQEAQGDTVGLRLGWVDFDSKKQVVQVLCLFHPIFSCATTI